MARRLKKRIYVNRQMVRKNFVNKTCEPVIVVRTYRDRFYAHTVKIHGASELIYSPDKPCAGGPRVWLETEAGVTAQCHGSKALYVE